MAYIASQIISKICKKLENSDEKQFYIDMAKEEVSECYFGSNYQKAIALLASHMYTVNNRTLGAGGAISSIKEGDLSLSYRSNGSGDYSSTGYGQQFQALLNKSGAGISVIGTDLSNTC